MKYIYDVYIDGGTVIEEGKEFKYKKCFMKYFDKKDALAYKKRLEDLHKNEVVVFEEKEIRKSIYF